MEYEVGLYEKVDKECPVLDFILSLNPKEQAKIYREIELLKKFGNELHFPHARKIEGGKYNELWELRMSLPALKGGVSWQALQTPRVSFCKEVLCTVGFTTMYSRRYRNQPPQGAGY